MWLTETIFYTLPFVRIEGISEQIDECAVGAVTDIIDGINLEPNVIIETIDRVYRLSFWK